MLREPERSLKRNSPITCIEPTFDPARSPALVRGGLIADSLYGSHCAGMEAKMTPEEKQAYEWALNQKFNSVAARYARVLAQYIERTVQIEDNGIVGQMFFVEAPNFEGDAEVLGVNDDDTVRVRSDWSGAIYTVDEAHLTRTSA